MKLSEAIEVLKRFKHCVAEGLNYDKIEEAIDTVVTALEKPLPSDEKIEQYAIENILYSDSIEAVVNMKAWIQGAIWMRDLMKKRVAK